MGSTRGCGGGAGGAAVEEATTWRGAEGVASWSRANSSSALRARALASATLVFASASWARISSSCICEMTSGPEGVEGRLEGRLGLAVADAKERSAMAPQASCAWGQVRRKTMDGGGGLGAAQGRLRSLGGAEEETQQEVEWQKPRRRLRACDENAGWGARRELVLWPHAGTVAYSVRLVPKSGDGATRAREVVPQAHKQEVPQAHKQGVPHAHGQERLQCERTN